MPWMCCHGCVSMDVLTHIPQICWCMVNVWQVSYIINTLESFSSQPQLTQSLGPGLVGTARWPSHPQVGLCCYMKNNMLWMGCHSFHMSYECIIKVLQAWDIINIMWSGSFKPQSTQVMGPDLTAYAKPPQAILVIEYIVKWRATCHGCVAKHSIWCMGHVQDPPSLGHNQYTGVLSIQTHKHPSCGTRFDENCKTTMPSSGPCILLHEEKHAMDMLPPIPFVGAWLRLTKHGTQSIHSDPIHPSLRAPKQCDQIWWELQNKSNNAILRLVFVVTKRTICHGCVAKHSIYLWVYGQGITSLKHSKYTGVQPIQPLNTQAMGPDLVRTAKSSCHPQVGVCCYTNNRMSWIWCDSFHIFCGCIGKVLQDRDMINTLGSCTKAPIHPQVGVYY